MGDTGSVCYPLPPLAAYAHDFAGREPDERDQTLWTWLQASLYLWRISQIAGAERRHAFEAAARALERPAGPAAPESAPVSDVAPDPRPIAHSPLAIVLGEVARRPDAVGAWGTRLSTLVRDGAEQLQRIGAFRLAYTLLASLRAAVQELPETDAGLVIAQQGRIARELGAAQTAEDHYRVAERMGRRTHAADLIARALLGRGILAATRGNYPAARAVFGQALTVSRRSKLTEHEGAAHNGLLMAAVAARDLDSALKHGWALLQCVGEFPERQAEVLVNLAEVALLAGHPESALGASLRAVELATAVHVRLAGYGTAATAASRLSRRDLLDQIAAESEPVLEQSHQPIERAYTLIELAESYAAMSLTPDARRFLERASDVATTGSFFEVTYRADRLAQRLAEAPPRPSTVADEEARAATGEDAEREEAAELSPASRKVIRSLAALRS